MKKLVLGFAVFVNACGPTTVETPETATSEIFTPTSPASATLLATSLIPTDSATLIPATPVSATELPPSPTLLPSPDLVVQLVFTALADSTAFKERATFLAESLAAQTDFEYRIAAPIGLEEALEALCNAGQVTIAFLPATTYIIGQEQCAAQAVGTAIMDGRAWSATAFMVARPSEAQALADLDGVRLAVAATDSVDKFLIPLAELKLANSAPAAIVDSGSAGAALLALYNGEVDVAAIPFIPPNMQPNWKPGDEPEPFDMTAIEVQSDGSVTAGFFTIRDSRIQLLTDYPDLFKATRILAIGSAIPNMTIAASAGFELRRLDELSAALLAFGESDVCVLSLCNPDFYGWESIADVTPEHYHRLVELLDTVEFTDEG